MSIPPVGSAGRRRSRAGRHAIDKVVGESVYCESTQGRIDPEAWTPSSPEPRPVRGSGVPGHHGWWWYGLG